MRHDDPLRQHPALYWWPARTGLFPASRTVAVEARRPPCAASRVSRAAWRRAARQGGHRFPSHQQLLTDDLVRCRQLRGMTERAVRRLLGRPTESSGRPGAVTREWNVGLERDSLFQLDGEYLSVTFGARGRVRQVLQS